MTEDTPKSKRETARRAARKRREARADLRRWSLEALSRGWDAEEIADMRKVSVRTIRREIAAAATERQLEGAGAYVHAQVARLNKALRVADGALDRGNLKAVGPMVRLVAALDRYHGLGGADARRSAAALQAPRAPATPCALTAAAQPLAISHSNNDTYADSEKRTVLGA
jgi:hypothetical protein